MAGTVCMLIFSVILSAATGDVAGIVMAFYHFAQDTATDAATDAVVAVVEHAVVGNAAPNAAPNAAATGAVVGNAAPNAAPNAAATGVSFKTCFRCIAFTEHACITGPWRCQ